MPVKTEAQPYLDAFAPDAGEPAWLVAARREALTKFGEHGFPSRKEEAWRFTNLRSFANVSYPPRGRGRFVFPTGLPKGVWLGSIAQTIATLPKLARELLESSYYLDGHPFAALNAALFGDGYVLVVEPGLAVDKPIEIVHEADSMAAESIHLRNAIMLPTGSRATVIETYRGSGPYWCNAVTSVGIGDGSALTQVKVQDEDTRATHFGTERVALGTKARFNYFGLTLGANLSRQEIYATHRDGSEANVSGAYLQRGDQDTTNVISIDHALPNATTRELWKGVLDERAHGAFLGRILVRPDAQKTDAQQTSRALLLSDRASVDTKPELEILADDVKCAHGAAIGDLDRDMLFYLRARGIGADEARRMLISAFVLDAIATVKEPALREHLTAQVQRWLDGVVR